MVVGLALHKPGGCTQPRLPLVTNAPSLSSPLQEITTRDETGAPCARGMRTTPFGQYVADGPPTSLSGESRCLCS